MTTQFKTKEQVKAEQNASQDIPSQDDAQSLSITDGVTKFYETRCEFYENVFLQADQQAAKDVMGKFLTYDKSNREAVGGAFFGNLATKRQALSFGLLPSLFLPEAAEVDDKPISQLGIMCGRNDDLVLLQETGVITPEESAELAELQVKLREAGVIE